MKRHSHIDQLKQVIKKKVCLIGAACLILSLPMFPLLALEELPSKRARPNSTHCLPTRTIPNDVLNQQSLGLSSIALLTHNQTSARTSQPSLSSQQKALGTDVLISGGRVDVQLINRTGIAVSYEAIQQTDYAQLSPGKKITLQDLIVPTTLLLDRMDRGNLKISTRVFPGLLEVSLYPAANFNDDKGVVRIEESGTVFLN